MKLKPGMIFVHKTGSPFPPEFGLMIFIGTKNLFVTMHKCYLVRSGELRTISSATLLEYYNPLAYSNTLYVIKKRERDKQDKREREKNKT